MQVACFPCLKMLLNVYQGTKTTVYLSRPGQGKEKKGLLDCQLPGQIELSNPSRGLDHL